MVSAQGIFKVQLLAVSGYSKSIVHSSAGLCWEGRMPVGVSLDSVGLGLALYPVPETKRLGRGLEKAGSGGILQFLRRCQC